jgi:hypothetical protein
VTPALARREIAELRSGPLAALDRQKAGLLADLAEANRAATFSPMTVRAIRSDLSAVAVQRRELLDRITTLTRALPSERAIATARQDLARLQAAETAAASAFETAAQEFLGALERAEQAARQLAAARRAAFETSAAAHDVAVFAGLDARPPDALSLPREQAALAQQQALAASEVATSGSIDETTLRYLAAARAALTAAA